MTDCCQGTYSPVGKLCKDCPHKKPTPPDDMSPEAVGRRLKQSNLRGDEPWPGYSNGRPLIKKEEDDGIVEGYGKIDPPPHDDDDPTDVFFNGLVKNFADMMGMTYDEMADMLSKPFTGGIVSHGGYAPLAHGLIGEHREGCIIPCKFERMEGVHDEVRVVVNYTPPDVAYVRADEETLKTIQKKIAEAMALPPRFLR